MPRWTDQLPKATEEQSYRLLRTPTNRPFCAIITCPSVLAAPVHFYAGRTIPCESHNCEPCSVGHAYRWKGWVSCWMQHTNEHVLFEMPAGPARQLAEYRDANATLRGAYFRTTRVNERPNGRVILHVKQADLTGLALPSPPDVKAVLCHIWGVAYEQPEAAAALRNEPRTDTLPIKEFVATHSRPRGNGSGPPRPA